MISSAATVIRIAVLSLKISGETDPEVLCKNYISRFQSGSRNTDMQSSVSSPVRGIAYQLHLLHLKFGHSFGDTDGIYVPRDHCF